ncbi:MAG: hypothetical protein L0Y71_08825 [Gemmataceae bacterium]|nr:hypothetical protein [Gemmataceae bacterium]
MKHVCMKRVFAPVTALALAATGYSLQAAGWLQPSVVPPGATQPQTHIRQSTADAYQSEAAFRHRTCQSNHWRSLLLVK